MPSGPNEWTIIRRVSDVNGDVNRFEDAPGSAFVARTRPSHFRIKEAGYVGSKLKCPVLLASEVSDSFIYLSSSNSCGNVEKSGGFLA